MNPIGAMYYNQTKQTVQHFNTSTSHYRAATRLLEWQWTPLDTNDLIFNSFKLYCMEQSDFSTNHLRLRVKLDYRFEF